MKNHQFATLVGLVGAALTAGYVVTERRHEEYRQQGKKHHEEWKTIASTA
ncbi:hypothetical protein [Streptomyces sp. Tu6071]|nr:hypothetical protein [Streptomyces sp. Tu6071]